MFGIALCVLSLTVADKTTESKIKPFESPVVAFHEKAPPAWTFREAKRGGPLWSDRDYAFSALPAEIAGGTQLYRDTGHIARWLGVNQLTARKSGTVYAIIRWKYLGKEKVSEADFARLEKEGWKPVKGDVETTFPAKEDWRWKAVEKKFEKGDLILDLKNVQVRTAVLFVFK